MRSDRVSWRISPFPWLWLVLELFAANFPCWVSELWKLPQWQGLITSAYTQQSWFLLGDAPGFHLEEFTQICGFAAFCQTTGFVQIEFSAVRSLVRRRAAEVHQYYTIKPRLPAMKCVCPPPRNTALNLIFSLVLPAGERFSILLLFVFNLC